MSKAPEGYQEIIECKAEVDQGLIFIRVTALPYDDSVEFDVTQARAFAKRILDAVAKVEAGWVGPRELWGKPMSSPAKDTRATIIPAMRYHDAPAAIEWLCKVFGFEKHLVVPGPNNTIAHAELSFGNGMIMLGSANDTEYGKLVTHPSETGGLETQTIYAIVDDVDAHYAKAKAAGAKIVIDIKTEDYGGRDYTCRDLEGHVWTFGSFDPWANNEK